MKIAKMNTSQMMGKVANAKKKYLLPIDKNMVIRCITEHGDVSVFKIKTSKGLTKSLAKEEKLMHIRLDGSRCNINGKLVKNYQVSVSSRIPNSNHPLIYVSFFSDILSLYKQIVAKIIAINPFIVVLEISDNPFKKELYKFMQEKFQMCIVSDSYYHPKKNLLLSVQK